MTLAPSKKSDIVTIKKTPLLLNPKAEKNVHITGLSEWRADIFPEVFLCSDVVLHIQIKKNPDYSNDKK